MHYHRNEKDVHRVAEADDNFFICDTLDDVSLNINFRKCLFFI